MLFTTTTTKSSGANEDVKESTENERGQSMECETADNYEPGLLTAEVMSIKQSKPECEPEETGAQIGR